MMLVQKIFPLLLAWVCTLSGFAQQLPRFSQYYSNEFSGESFCGRKWRTDYAESGCPKAMMGFSDFTPSSYMLSMQGRILKKSYILRPGVKKNSYRKSTKGRVGPWGNYLPWSEWAIERTEVSFSYAYHVFVDNSQLSFGLTGNVFQYRINPEHAQLKDPI